MKKNVALILDTYAHSLVNCYYAQHFPTVAKAKQKWLELLAKEKITMRHEGDKPIKIYLALIERRNEDGDFERVLITRNGYTWEKEEGLSLQHTCETRPISEIFE